jgi:hypothetical protein
MNAYQYQRLAAEFGVIRGETLKAAIEGEIFTTAQIAAMCSTSPAHFTARLAWWDSEDAPTAPPVVTSDRIDG